MKVKVIHTLQKPYERLYAGIYIQEPIDGVLDKYGKPFRAIHEEIGVRDVPNKAKNSNSYQNGVNSADITICFNNISTA